MGKFRARGHGLLPLDFTSDCQKTLLALSCLKKPHCLCSPGARHCMRSFCSLVHFISLRQCMRQVILFGAPLETKRLSPEVRYVPSTVQQHDRASTAQLWGPDLVCCTSCLCSRKFLAEATTAVTGATGVKLIRPFSSHP